VYATPASPRAFTARLRYSPSVVGPESVTGADHAFPFGFVADWTTLRVPSQTFHVAVTFPAASMPTGAERVMETPPRTNVASVEVVHADDPAGLTATWTLSFVGDEDGSWETQETAVVPSAPIATRGVIANPFVPEIVNAGLHRPPTAADAPIDAEPPLLYVN
jgi:hypothetical protein